MTSKLCVDCHKPTPLEGYHRNPTYSDGRGQPCKGCVRARQQERRLNRSYLERRLYNGMVRRCSWFPRYKTFKPSFTLKEFIDFCNAKGNLNELYAAWREDNFSRRLAPSVDRVDNERGYDLDNIEIVSSAENSRRAGAFKRMKRDLEKLVSEE